MVASAPVASTEGGAVADKAGEGGGDANGATGVGADGGVGGAFEDAGDGTAGGATGKRAGVAGLDAIAELGIFAGDAVGEGVEMGFADNDGAKVAQSFDEPGILGGDAVFCLVELGAEGGGGAGEIEAILNRNGEASEGGVGRGAAGFGEGKGFVLPEVGIVTGAGVRFGEGGDDLVEVGRHSRTHQYRGRVLLCNMGVKDSVDEERMEALVEFTARSMKTERPVPFGASIVHSVSGEMLLRALNAVAEEHDPSSHAEVRAIRLATKELKSTSLGGYTLYTTCEPCPMCMSAALWAGLDRVVYGATIEDANRHCRQILISAREVAERSDMGCEVAGPVLRDRCYTLFTEPNMLRVFAIWQGGKSKLQTGTNE